VIDDMVVVDATVHCYNWSRENQRTLEAGAFEEAGWGSHQLLTLDDETRLPRDQYVVDWTAEELEQILIHETSADVVCYHGTPIWDYFYDGHIAFAKGAELKRRHPDRVFLYGPVNPLETYRAVEEMTRMREEHRIDGIKLYPAQYYRGRTLPHGLDDPRLGHPLIEAALELGIDVIAVHKAFPFGPVNSAYFNVGDIDNVAALYPEMRFEIVHAGYAFLEETALAREHHPNVYANLEGTAGLIIRYPKLFAQAMARLLLSGAEDRIFFATGCTLAHLQPTLEAVAAFAFPPDIVEGLDLPAFDAAVKRKILGENFLRMHGVDAAELKERIAGDAWDQARSATLAAPWSTTHQLRAQKGVG
jgi:predicted TIM-barrel fold metal-dependent hydrolase